MLDRSVLVFLERSQPLGPIGPLRSSGFGPVTIGVELSVPLEGVELSEANLAGGPVQEEDVYKAVVTV